LAKESHVTSIDPRPFVEQLRRRREAILEEVARVERDLKWIAEDRESEFEERAQEERSACLLARLDDVGKREIEEIDEALRRVSAGTYGICAQCGGRIPQARLRALPMTRVCIDCAREEESEARQLAPHVDERSAGRGPSRERRRRTEAETIEDGIRHASAGPTPEEE
jgi:DnaK suppressor protein